MGNIPTKRFLTKIMKEAMIRTAEIKDAEPIIELMKKVISERKYTLAESGEYKATKKSEEEKIYSYNKSEGKLLIVAEVDKKIAGYLEFSNWPLHRTSHSGMLSMFLLKEFREIGIGTMLLKNLLEWAEKNDTIEKVTLAVFSNNERAIALYNKLGFEIEGRCPRDIKMLDGTYIDSVLMYMFVK